VRLADLRPHGIDHAGSGGTNVAHQRCTTVAVDRMRLRSRSTNRRGMRASAAASCLHVLLDTASRHFLASVDSYSEAGSRPASRHTLAAPGLAKNLTKADAGFWAAPFPSTAAS
jgi:hypothetical protein